MIVRNPHTPDERYGLMDTDERKQLIETYLTRAFEKWKTETGQHWSVFFANAVEFMGDWLIACGGVKASEFVQALPSMHGPFTEGEYAAAVERYEKAKADLLDLLAKNSAAGGLGLKVVR